MTNFRMERIRSAVLEEIGRLLVQEEISDPRVSSMVLVRDVSVSKDLQHAKVHISGYLSERRLSRAVEGLNHAAGFIQAKLAQRLRMKSTPRLEFLVDHSIEHGFEITEKLRELRQEESDTEGEQSGDISEG
jgi:ribosome-binding factor A